MGMIASVELWDGRKRIAEELKGNVQGADMYLGPRGKIPDDLTKTKFYTASTPQQHWTVEFLSFDNSGVKLRVKDGPHPVGRRS